MTLTLALAALLFSPAGGWVWLPADTLHPRDLADPREPMVALTASDDRLDADIGLPLPVAGWGGDTRYRLVLEAGFFTVLGRDGAFFPMETVDGLFTLAVEVQKEGWHAKGRLAHISSHQADGDTLVAYRRQTSSREFATLELGRMLDIGLFLYVRAGASWHAVPEDNGLQTAVGGVFIPVPRGTGFVAAVHLDSDANNNWRWDKSLFAGIGLGSDRRMRAGVSYYRGNSPVGQNRSTPLHTLGLELQFAP